MLAHLRRHVLLVLLVGLTGCHRHAPSRRTQQPLVLAASRDLRGSLSCAGRLWGGVSKVKLTIDYESPGELLTRAASADAVLATDRALDRLEQAKTVIRASRRPVVADELVIAAAADTVLPLQSPQDLPKLMTASPHWTGRLIQSAPAESCDAAYAEAYLRGLRIAGTSVWEQLAPQRLDVPTQQAELDDLAQGRRMVSVLFLSTVIRRKGKIRVLFAAPPSAPRVRFSSELAAELPPARAALARRLQAVLSSAGQAACFSKLGFTPLGGTR